MVSFAISLLLLSISVLVLFLVYKRIESYRGRDFAATRFLSSFDTLIYGILLFVREFLFSYRQRTKLFILTRVVYPVRRIFRRVRFRVSMWYLRALERLREKHMERYRSQASSYLRNVATYKDTGHTPVGANHQNDDEDVHDGSVFDGDRENKEQ